MKKLSSLLLAAILFAGLCFLGDPPVSLLLADPLPMGLTQKQIDAAIARGVKYLKSNQDGKGTWGKEAQQAIGYAALPGLTLLECGVDPQDQLVQKAAAFVRKYIPKLNTHFTTYEVSLAILFLDRLGDPRDKELIRVLALHLVAGQTSAGGWDYFLPILSKTDMDKLHVFLERNRPKTSFGDPVANQKMNANPLAPDKNGKLADPFAGDRQLFATPLAGNKTAAGPADVKAAAVPPKEPQPDPIDNPKMAAPKTPDKGGALRPDFLPKNLQNIPAVASQGKKKGKASAKNARDDNSNSQFAMLALWTARRHGVPTEQSLLLAYQRFYTSQLDEGGWAYKTWQFEQTPSMTCVGLLGLALGHGSAPEVPQAKMPRVVGQSTREDPAIQKGLKAWRRILAGQRPIRRSRAWRTSISCGRSNGSPCFTVCKLLGARTGTAGVLRSSCPISKGTAAGNRVTIPVRRRPSIPASPCCFSSVPTWYRT